MEKTDKQIINEFLRKSKKFAAEITALENEQDKLINMVKGKQKDHAKLVEWYSEKLNLKIDRISSDLLTILDNKIWHDGTGELFRLETDGETKEVRFNNSDCFGFDLKEYCGQISDDG